MYERRRERAVLRGRAARNYLLLYRNITTLISSHFHFPEQYKLGQLHNYSYICMLSSSHVIIALQEVQPLRLNTYLGALNAMKLKIMMV